jgi:hypothetical protein
MSRTVQLITNLAVALGLIAGLAFSAATPSLARESRVQSKTYVLVNRWPSYNPNGYGVGRDPDPFIRNMLRLNPPGSD